MPEIILANEYTNIHAYRWVAPPKPKIMAVPRRQLPESDKDELARIREMNAAQVERDRFPGQDDFEDAERQAGEPMHSSDFVAKVLKLNPALIVEDSLNCRGHAAFYYATPGGEKKYTNASFRKGILPEFCVIEPDAAGQPVRVQYGWREVLLRLVKARQLSFRQVVRMFGDAETVQASTWRRNIRNFRR